MSVQQKIRDAGVTYLDEAEVLAAVGQLSPAVARRMVSEIGSLNQMRTCTIEELQQYPGVGLATAAAIKAAFGLAARMSQGKPQPVIDSPQAAADIFISRLLLEEQEHLEVMSLSTKNRVLAVDKVYIGSVSSVAVRLADIFKFPLRRNATTMILAHNHPSGDPAPSPEDVAVTHRLQKAGELVGLELLDHIIVGGKRYVSLKERGCFN